VVGLVLVAHSAELLVGLRAMVGQAAPPVPVALAGGTARGTLGTSAPAIRRAIHDALEATEDGAVILIDLGSAALAVEIALEALTPDQLGRVRLSDGPIVEGAVLAAVEAASGASLEEVLRVANAAALAPKRPDGPLRG
jgi:PTS hybrid protein